LNREIGVLVQANPVCRRLTALEGVGPIGSVLLYATLGTGEAFANDRWLWAIVERSGKCKAAVALANKNVRTARAMLTQNTEYQRYPLAA